MAKPKTVEEAKALVQSTKEAQSAAWAELVEFRKEHKLKPTEDYSKHKDPKIAKGFTKLKAAHAEAKKANEAAKSALKAMKPERSYNSKYEYPEGVNTPEEKKKWRTQQRAAARKAESGDSGKASKKTKAAEKPAKKAEKPAKAEKSKGKGKEETKPKKGKASRPAEDGDDD